MFGAQCQWRCGAAITGDEGHRLTCPYVFRWTGLDQGCASGIRITAFVLYLRLFEAGGARPARGWRVLADRINNWDLRN